jgi:hypothetical protein
VSIRILQPRDWPRPRGYANGVSARGRQIYVAGQIGWNENGVLVGKDLVSQARQAPGTSSRFSPRMAPGPSTGPPDRFVVDRNEYIDEAGRLARRIAK